jgi:hypothetical protein
MFKNILNKINYKKHRILLLCIANIYCYVYSSVPETIEINNIKVVGVTDEFEKYLVSLLPFKKGEQLTLSRLEKLVKKQNLIYMRRGEILVGYKLMIIPPVKYPEKRSLLLRVDPRFGFNYGGGNAYGFIGSQNRTGKGEQWELTLGKNRDGIRYEFAIAEKKYIGIDLRYDCPTQLSYDLMKHHFLEYKNYLRMKLSEEWQLQLGIGAIGEIYRNNKHFHLRNKYAEGSLTVTSDFVYLMDLMGIGYCGTHVTKIGKSITSPILYSYIYTLNSFLTRELRRFSTFMQIDCGYFGLDKPSILPVISNTFYIYEHLNSGKKLSKSFVFEINERFRVFDHQFLFTHINYYLIAFNELSVLGASKFNMYDVAGTGLLINLSNPVKMDFCLKFGLFPRYKGIQFVARQSF